MTQKWAEKVKEGTKIIDLKYKRYGSKINNERQSLQERQTLQIAWEKC